MQAFGHKGRLEDARMLTGQGRYVSDWQLPGQAHGCFVRSDRAHAELLGIDSSAAMGMPGVIAVLTGTMEHAEIHRRISDAGRQMRERIDIYSYFEGRLPSLDERTVAVGDADANGAVGAADQGEAVRVEP